VSVGWVTGRHTPHVIHAISIHGAITQSV
jgi:hypothetical protein